MNLNLFHSLLSRPTLTSPAPTSSAFYMNLTPHLHSWSRNIIRNGGYWQGKFVLRSYGSNTIAPVAPSTLTYLFYNMLGWHVQESDGPVTWEGYVHEVYLSTGNTQRVRTYNDLYNHITAKNKSGEVVDVVQNEDSILRYGQIEQEIKVETGGCYAPTATIQEQLDSYLDCVSVPYTKSASRIDHTDEYTLEVRVSGYFHTASWRLIGIDIGETFGKVIDCAKLLNYVQNNCGSEGFDPGVLLGGSVEYNELITYILDNYCDYLWPGIIQDSKMRKKGVITGTPLTALVNLAEDGGGPLNGVERPFWRIFASAGRLVHYTHIDTSVPRYQIVDNGEWINTGGGQISEYHAQPAVVEDLEFPASAGEPGSIFPRSTMFYVDDVSVSGIRSDNDDASLDWRSTQLKESNQIKIIG